MLAFLANVILGPIYPLFIQMMVLFIIVVLLESLIFYIKSGSWPNPPRPTKIFKVVCVANIVSTLLGIIFVWIITAIHLQDGGVIWVSAWIATVASEWPIYRIWFWDKQYMRKATGEVVISANLASYFILFIIMFIIGAASRINSHDSFYEHSAITRLKTLATSQAQFQSQAQVDQDQDGTGEYGLLGELAGLVKRRGSDTKCNPSFISASMAPQYDYSGKAGRPDPFMPYGRTNSCCFQVFLPHQDKVITDLPAEQPVSTDPASINVQETIWIAYAWPMRAYRGHRCFALDQSGEIYFAFNRQEKQPDQPMYEGTGKVPAYNAAVPNNGLNNTMTWYIQAGQAGSDGQIWYSLDNPPNKNQKTTETVVTIVFVSLVMAAIMWFVVVLIRDLRQ